VRAARENSKLLSDAKSLFGSLGPGLITGASDDDPSGIGTYSQAGAQFGFGVGWTMVLAYPLMVAIQEIAARVGRVTGHGIAGNVCRNFPAPAIWFLIVFLFIANTINIAADLGAMADSLKTPDRRTGHRLRCFLWDGVGTRAGPFRIQALRLCIEMVDP
jgi:Mn2+/Fe2+ NRAMP family transporter